MFFIENGRKPVDDNDCHASLGLGRMSDLNLIL